MSVRVDVVERLARVCVVLSLCAAMPGCKKKDTTSPGGADKAGEAQTPSDSIGDPVAELAALEGRMRTLGLPVAADKREMTEAEGEADGVGEAETGGAGGDVEDKLAEEAPAPAAQVGGTQPSRDETINYCGDLCSLSESICTLEVRICSLAEAHANDMVYADACERAVEDCEVAGEACDTCG